MELKIYKCKYCNTEYVNAQTLGGHISKCKLNPNYNQNMMQLERARLNILHLHTNKHLHCQYCNKEISNEGCLVLHERRCKLNPNYVPTIKQQEKIDKPKTKQPIHLSEEHKQKIRIGLMNWKKNHQDEFLAYSRGQSKCCENFKQMLRNNNIDFIEEYMPFSPERLYRLDIAFPDEKIGIEINGSQHYNSDGTLNESTLAKQTFFENAGWKIFQIYYKQCYSININNFADILSLPIYDKHYVKQDYDNKYQKQLQKEKTKQLNKEKQLKRKLILDEQRKSIILNLINNSGIDFSKSTWSKQAVDYLKQRGELWNKVIFKCIRKYAPDFLKQDNVWKRKGSIY